MTTHQLLDRWTTPNADGTYDVWGVYGSRVARNVSKAEAVAAARQMQARHDRTFR